MYHTTNTFPFNSIAGLVILATLLIIVFVFACIISVLHHKLYECQYVIVRLINEKEELKKQLPPGVSARYLSCKLTRTELLSIVKMINSLLIPNPNGAGWDQDQPIPPRNGQEYDLDQPIQPPNDNG